MEDTEMEPRKYQECCWSQLPQDLVVIIANRLNAIEDFLSFSSVCSSWRTAIPKEEWNPSSSIPRLPWLLLTKYEDRFSGSRCLYFYNMERKKLYPVKNPLLKHTTNGWIFKTDSNLSQLIDPLTGFQITLPPINNSESIAKVLVSLRPLSESDNNTNNDNIVVVVMFFGSVRLRFARSGFKEWVMLQDGFDYERRTYFYNDRSIYIGDKYFGDVVCYKGRVFAVCSNGTFVVCEFDRPSPKAIAISPPPPLKYRDVYAYYLVESGGDLLFVIQYNNRDTIERAIEVYKFNGADNEGGGVWTKLEDLGGCTLFLSHSYSVSIPPTDQVDCRADCIYYTTFHCRFRISCNVNVFDMKDNTTEHYSFTNLSHLSNFRGSVWVPPTSGLHCVMPSSS